MTAYAGPADRLGPGLHPLAPGLWLTSGRAVVAEGERTLSLVDPGDEPMLTPEGRPTGFLAELLSLCERTGKSLGAVFLTHAHPDHTANLGPLRAYGQRDERVGAFRLLAHERSPFAPDLPIGEAGGEHEGIRILPTPGHSPFGDDLSFFFPEAGVLLSGDLVQPKGERWEETFYPSPYPFFTDGDRYLASLDALLALPFRTLVTGHREVRFTPEGRAWVELTRRAVAAVGEKVAEWTGGDDLAAAAPEIYRSLARERGIDDETIDRRMAPDASGSSAFSRFDLPGIAWFWKKLRTPEPAEASR